MLDRLIALVHQILTPQKRVVALQPVPIAMSKPRFRRVR